MADDPQDLPEEETEETPEEISEESEETTPSQPEKTQLFEGNVTPRSIETEIEQSYLNYAMSVIVSRALPDVRDGLKPVHRRILYAMHETGLRSTAGLRKSATVVGEVMAKYHPHGDAAIYDSMVRMAQDFSLRYPLVRGQGNFGSVDGDNAAAMRYTEAKMEKITDEMLKDIEKETVDFVPNYDGRHKEPRVLPTKLPQLLLNGTMGIAVGMATNIPPHNLTEVMDALLHLTENPESEVDDLMKFIKGPDFPTGATIYDKEAIKTMYTTGRGGIAIRAKAEIEEMKSGRSRILVTEIPYQLNKASLVEKIADLVRTKKITGISDLRDESNREGMRIVIELKKDSYPNKILNQLYKYSPMQSSFNMNMIALVDGLQPRLLNLKEVLEYFIEHRKVVITRRTEYDLKVAQARAHILEGLKIALDNIDAVIETIRASATKEEAHSALMEKFHLSELQATAILEMRLQTLAGLERSKIEDELKEKLALIKELEAILADPKKVEKIMQEEFVEIKEQYGDKRRTKIVAHAIGQFSMKDTIPNEEMVVTLTKANYIKRVAPSAFRRQERGGQGKIAMTTKEEDEIQIVKQASNHDKLLFFTNTGRVFQLPVYEVPQATRQAKGTPLVNLIQLNKDEVVTAVQVVTNEKFGGEFLFMATKDGTVKKTPVDAFEKVRKSGLVAIKLREGDSLSWVRQTSKGDKVIIVTREGKCIQFGQEDVRPMGRASTGVRGIKLKTGDEVVEMDTVKTETTELFVVMENGVGKRTTVSSYRLQTRGGTGVKTANLTQKTGKLVGARVVEPDMEADVIIVSRGGVMIRVPLTSIPSRGRATQGVYIMRMKQSDRVASMSLINTAAVDADNDTPEEDKTKKSQAALV
ncbi:DNA gyrase subunit A [Patescibacteria group bacterium]|nr:DNA gyrase subunit A [Patescibacteria group bacterium]